MKIALFALVIVATVITLAILKRRTPRTAQLPDFYGKKPILSAVEQILYFKLIETLPDHIVLAQVAMNQVVGIKKGPLRQGWFNKITQKSLDFLICTKDAKIVAAIELDDKTHDQPDRKAADADKDTAFTNAGIKIIRWTPKTLPNSDEIRLALQVPSP